MDRLDELDDLNARLSDLESALFGDKDANTVEEQKVKAESDERGETDTTTQNSSSTSTGSSIMASSCASNSA